MTGEGGRGSGVSTQHADQPRPSDPPAQSGHPRLALVPNSGSAVADDPEAFGYEAEYVLGQRTTIGSDASQDIVLDGLAAEHAVIEWLPEGDEYVFHPVVTDGAATIDGAIATTGIHHGDRLQLGAWTLIFQRDEGSDHVRRARSRHGGKHAGDTRTRPGGHHTETE